MKTQVRDAIVIGAGLAGLTAALRLAQAGADVTLVTKGTGGLPLSQGTLDVLGYRPQRVVRPFEDFDELADDHPYRLLCANQVRMATDFVAAQSDGLLIDQQGTNYQLPTAVGSVRPTAYAQPSMIAADFAAGKRYVCVGLRRLKDFQAPLLAANLARADLGEGRAEARHVWIDPSPNFKQAEISALGYARALDEPGFRAAFAAAVRGVVREDETVLLPAILGLADPQVPAEIAERIGNPVAEITLPPPSVPGLRLQRILLARLRAAGVRVISGAPVVEKMVAGTRLKGVVVASAGHPTRLAARSFVHAPGGFESGALHVDSHGSITETTFGLPLTQTSASGLISADFWASEQALFRVGVRVDRAMRPLGPDGDPVYSNLHAAGGILAGAMRWRELSGDGIAAGSALAAADQIIQETK